MSVPFLTVNPIAIKLKVLPTFNSTVVGRVGIATTKQNGNFFIDLNYGYFPPSPSVDPATSPNLYTLLWDINLLQYTLAPITQFAYVDAPLDGKLYGRQSGAWIAVGAQFLLVAGNQTTTGGFCFTSANIGTVSTGTITPNAMAGNYQYYTNAGAHTLLAPLVDCAIDILMTNGTGAGAVTFSGFTVGTTGDTLTTTVGNKFIFSVRRINGIATYLIKALQ
jgi:hypothetical protein